MPGFCREEHGSTLVMWFEVATVDVLPAKNLLWQPCKFCYFGCKFIFGNPAFYDPSSMKFHNQMTLIESNFLWSILNNVCNAWKNNHQNHTKVWNIWNMKCFTIPYLDS